MDPVLAEVLERLAWSVAAAGGTLYLSARGSDFPGELVRGA